MVVEPSFGMVAWLAFAFFVATPAGIVTALKGQWLWLVLGVLTCGLAFVWSAFLEPKPGSLWHRWQARRHSVEH